MGIWINRGKQQFLAVLCLHFATSLINSVLCAAACFCCCSALRFYSALRLEVDHSASDISGKAQQCRVQSGACLREQSWGGTVPCCQMLVKNTRVTQPMGEANVWTLRPMYGVSKINMQYCFLSWTISVNHTINFKQRCCVFWGPDSAPKNPTWWVVKHFGSVIRFLLFSHKKKCLWCLSHILISHISV